jgi:UDP-N-acetyl-alpha-D-muramoyl-L-alanyl-L-glutamate epimerase
VASLSQPDGRSADNPWHQMRIALTIPVSYTAPDGDLMKTQLVLDPIQRSRRQLVLNYRVDDIPFHTVYWYDTVDFHALEERFGEPFMRKVYFHLLAYEANKAASLKPDVLDPGPYADLYTDAFYDAWITIFRGVWGVWRYDNDIRDYNGPKVSENGSARRSGVAPATLGGGDRLLALCGGGKDSLASFKLLERAGVAYDAMVYSHNIYGKAQPQHDLIDGMLRHTTAGQIHRAWVYDTALDSPAARLYPEYGIRNILAAETVSSYWTALPIALAHNYTRVALGVTKSTDEHNLVWPETGEAINYLWGMSTAAETLLHDYVQAEIATDVSFFHLLRPIYDITVFSLLTGDRDAVIDTHSCAQVKPWCGKCAKCLYVWLHLVAYLDDEVVHQMFDKNLFDIPGNRSILRKMLGLEGNKPADCVGTVSETQAAYLLARARGWHGAITDDISPADIPLDVEAFLNRYAIVDPPRGAIPLDLYERIRPQMAAGAEAARTYVREMLEGT